VKIRGPVVQPRRVLSRRRLSSTATGNSYRLTGSSSSSAKSSKKGLGIRRVTMTGTTSSTFAVRFREARIRSKTGTGSVIPAQRRTGSRIISHFRLLSTTPSVYQWRHHSHFRVEYLDAAFRRLVAIATNCFRFRFRVPIAVGRRAGITRRFITYFRLSDADADDSFVRTAGRKRRRTGRFPAMMRDHRRLLTVRHRIISGHVVHRNVTSGIDAAISGRSKARSELRYSFRHIRQSERRR